MSCQVESVDDATKIVTTVESRVKQPITIGAVVTLFVLMQATARVEWNEIFADGASRAPA